jgi:chromosome segregation ATPase
MQTVADETTTTTGTPQAEPADQPAAADQERKFSQADLQRLLDQHTARERSRAEAAATAERQKAEQAQLAAKAEWEELAKQHEQTVRELQPQLDSYKTRLETLSERLNKQIEQGIRDWPAEARKMVPATDDVAARLDAYENMRNLLDGGRLAGRQPGNGTGPRPTAGPAASEKTEELLRSNPRYNAL